MVVSILLLFVVGAHANDKASSQHLCDFSLLSKDIQNHIAIYLFSDLNERVFRSKGKLQQLQLSSNSWIKIKMGSLFVESPNNFLSSIMPLQKSYYVTCEYNPDVLKYYRLHKKHFNKIVQDNDEYKELLKIVSKMSKSPENRSLTNYCQFFNVSPDRRLLSVFVAGSFDGRNIPIAKGEYIKIYGIKNKQLIFRAELILDSLSELEEKKRKFENHKDIRLLLSNKIKTIAVSNNGKLVLANDYQVFLVEDLKACSYKEIYRIPSMIESCVIPDNNLPGWPNTIVNLVFSRDGTKVGIVFHYLYDAFFDGENLRETFDKELFKRLVNEFYKNHFKNFNAYQFTDISDFKSPLEYLEALRSQVSHTDHTTFDMVYEKLRVGIDHACRIKFIDLKNQEQETLKDYFRFSGVCKDLHKQCGFK